MENNRNHKNNNSKTKKTNTINKNGNVQGNSKNSKKVGFFKKHPKLKKFLIIAILAVILLILIAVGIFAGIFFSDKFALTKDDLSIALSNTIVYDKDGNVIAELSGSENRKVISIGDMSEYLPKAYVAIEDERFYEHQGVDLKRTAAATVSYVFHGGNSSFGGSTITQQLVKNITNEKDKSGTAGIERKIKEMSRAYQIEKMISKDQILELYLNLIPLGADGGDICGVETASIYYFNKSASQLEIEECAFLAGINHAPNRYNPFKGNDNSELIKTRTKTVLQKMKELKYITDEQYNTAVEKVDAGLNFSKGTLPTSNVKSYYISAAIEQVVDQLVEEKGMSEEYARSRVYGGGYKIYTTENSSIQSTMETEFTNTKYIKSSKNVADAHSQAAMVMIDHSTGQVVACVGGLGSDVNALGINRIYSKRQPGSSIKPLAVYGAGLEKGVITAGTVYDNSPTTFGTNYSPSSTSAKSGLCTIRDAIEVSSNVVACKVMSELGPDNAIDILREFGITSVVKSSENSSANDSSLSLALGGVTYGISPLEMAAAYAAIANNGVYITPTFYTKVEDANGNVILESHQESRRVLSEGNAYILQSIMRNPVEGSNGTARVCAISGMWVSAKTGTTNDNYDRWLCGFTPYYTAATWYGYDENEQVKYSGNPAAQIWAAVMKKVHTDLSGKDYEKPTNVVSATICRDSGCLATESCTNTYTEYFVEGTVPQACEGHKKYTICNDTGKIATEYCTNTSEVTVLVKPEKEANGSWTTSDGGKYTEITETCDIHTAATTTTTTTPETNTTNNNQVVDNDITVPNVIGKTEADAKKSLSDLTVTVDYTTKNDSTKADGVVLDQSKSAGTIVSPKAKITIYVNKITTTDGDDTNSNATT